MPKLKKERATSKLHTSASAKPSHSNSGGSGGGWAVSASKKKKKRSAAADDEIAVEEADLLGLDVESAAHESESSKRAAMADALKELIAMGDDDGDDDSDDDLAGLGGMGDDDDDDSAMDARQPTKGALQVKAKTAIALAKMAPAQAATASDASFAVPAKLTFAPSAPQRHSAAALVASARAAVAAAAAASSVPVDPSAPVVPAKIQSTKLDKRTLKHDRLMSRLALPGTAAAMARRSAAGSSFQNLRQLGTELNTSVLTPTQQNAIALLQQKQAAAAAAGASDKRDVLFLSDDGDKERLRQLQKQINSVKQHKAVAVPRATVGAQSAATAAASASAASAPAAAVPSPFLPQKPLSKHGRARQHASELAQFTAVLHHPQFQQAPLQSLSLHLHNSATLQKLQHEAAGISDIEATQPKKQQTGSQKKKNKAAAARRAQIMQQANEMS